MFLATPPAFAAPLGALGEAAWIGPSSVVIAGTVLKRHFRRNDRPIKKYDFFV
jgi:hypothetical protein